MCSAYYKRIWWKVRPLGSGQDSAYRKSYQNYHTVNGSSDNPRISCSCDTHPILTDHQLGLTDSRSRSSFSSPSCSSVSVTRLASLAGQNVVRPRSCRAAGHCLRTRWCARADFGSARSDTWRCSVWLRTRRSLEARWPTAMDTRPPTHQPPPR